MALGRPAWTETRQALQKLLCKDEPTLRDNIALREKAFVSQNDAIMHLPAEIGSLYYFSLWLLFKIWHFERVA